VLAGAGEQVIKRLVNLRAAEALLTCAYTSRIVRESS